MSMEADNKTTNQEKKKKHFSFLYVLGGGFLKEDFFTRHTRMIVLVVILIFFFIGNRYTCLQKLREIDRLQQELRDVRFEALSQIEMLIEEQGIDLEGATTPPYELKK